MNRFLKSNFFNLHKWNVASRHFLSMDNPFQKVYPSAQEEAQKEVESALDIERSLFENSTNIHNPVKIPNLKMKMRPRKEPKPLLEQSTQKYSKPKLTANNYYPSKITDSVLGLTFTKLKLNDPIFNNLLTTVRSGKRRDKKRQVIMEGRRLILEALSCGLKLQTVIFSQKDQLELISEELLPLRENIEIYKVPQHDLKTWSTLTTPPGLLAIFDRPSDKQLQFPRAEEQLPITVVCDNIREPNNLGSIIRTCAAIPCQQVIILKGCCDPWETKSLRGGCGAQFRIQMKDDVEWNTVLDYLPEDFKAFAAENNLQKIKNYKFNSPKTNLITQYLDIGGTSSHYVIIIGGETHGVSDTAYDFLDCAGSNGSFLHIPLADGVESLNTSCALSLILFEIRRKVTGLNIKTQ